MKLLHVTEAPPWQMRKMQMIQNQRHLLHLSNLKQMNQNFIRKKIDYTLQALDIEKRKIDLIEQHVSRKTHKYQDDEDYSFLISLLPTIKQLNQLEKMKRQMKILGDVIEALDLPLPIGDIYIPLATAVSEFCLVAQDKSQKTKQIIFGLTYHFIL
uniref:BESS domain-containing protein n=1 Tax=Timema genevievae TaxID=629358 RepID=A0A7R9PGM6_TIMGE|nr:unnamed protein product [Timema genevievae]